MRTINIHEAELIEQAAAGDSFIIAKAGKPMVKVIALDAPAQGAVRRIAFMAGQISGPDDFNPNGHRGDREVLW
jgi:antitoxin (DNA-binding transcriptional repressor) of toxin-antitoxin stability system